MGAAGTVRIPLRELRLQGTDKAYRSLRIRTEDGMILVGKEDAVESNRYEGQLLERAGVTSDFRAALQEKPYRVRETRVCVLAPDYVAEKAAQRAVGRAAWRDDFSYLGYSGAYDRLVNYRLALRGVRRVVAARKEPVLEWDPYP